MTTGLAPVATTTAEATELLREALAHPATRRAARSGRHVVVLDLVAAAAAAGAAWLVDPAWPVAAVVCFAVAWPLAVAVAGGYARGTGSQRLPVRALLAAACGTATAAWALTAVAPGLADPASRGTATSTLLLVGAACAGSVLLRLLSHALAPARPLPTVLVGSGPQVHELLEEADRPGADRRFAPVAVYVPDATWELDSLPEPWPVPTWRGPEGDLLDLVRDHDAEAVVVAPGPGITHADLRRWAARLQHEGVDLLVSPGLRDVAASRLEHESLGGCGLVRVAPAPLSGPARVAKDVVDRAAAALLLVLFAPLLGILAVLIRADSPGRAFYTQTRVGRGGTPFTVFKLRTMCADADRLRSELSAVNESDRDGVLFKIKRDPRITRLGAFLRSSSLDELPQLLNVLRGEMSLIGPRPALPVEVQAYAPDLRRRLDVKPGLTGLWQVSGRSDLSWDDTVRLDLQYVDNWSWALDLRIALRTVGAVLARRGAY